MADSETIKNFAEGDIICREGDQGGDLLIIKSGVAEVFREREGQSFVLAHVGSGEILGVMSALSSGKRAASVRAKTAIIAQFIPKDQVANLVKTLPKWANAFIKDLTLRVEQADELYIKSASSQTSEPTCGPMLSLALQVAEGFQPLAEALAAAEKSVIATDEVLDKLAKILNKDRYDLRKIIDVFKDKGIVPSVSSNSGGSSLQSGIKQLNGLKFFVNIVREALTTNTLESLTTSLAHSERALLKKIAIYGSEKESTTDKEIQLSYDDIEEKFKNDNYDSHVLKVADHLKILRSLKHGQQHYASFIPSDLLLSIQSIDAIHAFDEMEESGSKLISKRTLVY